MGIKRAIGSIYTLQISLGSSEVFKACEDCFPCKSTEVIRMLRSGTLRNAVTPSTTEMESRITHNTTQRNENFSKLEWKSFRVLVSQWDGCAAGCDSNRLTRMKYSSATRTGNTNSEITEKLVPNISNNKILDIRGINSQHYKPQKPRNEQNGCTKRCAASKRDN